MVTNEQKQKNKAYSEALSKISGKCDRMLPFTCFTENRDWPEIGKEMDKIREQNELPVFDERPVRHGWVYIYTKKDSKKRVWIE